MDYEKCTCEIACRDEEEIKNNSCEDCGKKIKLANLKKYRDEKTF